MTEESIFIEEGAVPLLEAKPRADGAIPCAIITVGWGSSGYYSEALLREAAAHYKAGTHDYWNHQTPAEARERPERDLRDLAAVLVEDARFDPDGPKGPGLYSAYKPFSHYAGAIKEMAPHIGLSHVASGTAEKGTVDGRSGPVIKSITNVHSVDFVTVPGRGGAAVLEAFREAGRIAQQSNTHDGDNTMTPELTLEEVRKHPDIVEAIRKEVLESAAIKEAQAQQQKTLKEAQTALEEAKVENARLKEAQILVSAKVFVETKVKDAKIPDLTKARIIEALAKAPALKDGALDEPAYTAMIEAAIKEEADYLAKITGSGQIKGLGGGKSTSTETLEEARKELVEVYVASGMLRDIAEKAVSAVRSD